MEKKRPLVKSICKEVEVMGKLDLILKILEGNCNHQFFPDDPEGRTVGDLDGKCRLCGHKERRCFK